MRPALQVDAPTGVLTDALGFFCLLPAGRAVLKAWVRRRFEAGVRSGRIAVSANVRRVDMKNITPQAASGAEVSRQR